MGVYGDGFESRQRPDLGNAFKYLCGQTGDWEVAGAAIVFGVGRRMYGDLCCWMMAGVLLIKGSCRNRPPTITTFRLAVY